MVTDLLKEIRTVYFIYYLGIYFKLTFFSRFTSEKLLRGDIISRQNRWWCLPPPSPFFSLNTLVFFRYIYVVLIKCLRKQFMHDRNWCFFSLLFLLVWIRQMSCDQEHCYSHYASVYDIIKIKYFMSLVLWLSCYLRKDGFRYVFIKDTHQLQLIQITIFVHVICWKALVHIL